MRERFREALIAHMDATRVGATELSRATGVRKALIDKHYQRRTDATNVHDAMRLASYFGKTVNEMVGLSGDGETAQIAALIARLSPEEKRLVKAQLSGLVDRRP